MCVVLVVALMESSSEDEFVKDSVWLKKDSEWRKYSFGKYVYFRWSTAHNSKNRFKGVVVGHKSRMSGDNRRLDLLTIKTYGFSEDEYVIGKDVREMFVFDTKKKLNEITCDNDARRSCIRKWSSKEGWTIPTNSLVSTDLPVAAPVAKTDAPVAKSDVSVAKYDVPVEKYDVPVAKHDAPVGESNTEASLQAEIRPLKGKVGRPSKLMLSASTSASSSRVSSPTVRKMHRLPPFEGIRVISKHGPKSMAAKLGFSFAYNNILGGN